MSDEIRDLAILAALNAWNGHPNAVALPPDFDPERMRAAIAAYEAALWQPIASLPNDERMVVAATPDGRVMIWRASILVEKLAQRDVWRPSSEIHLPIPSHLQFPATRWRPMIEAPK